MIRWVVMAGFTTAMACASGEVAAPQPPSEAALKTRFGFSAVGRAERQVGVRVERAANLAARTRLESPHGTAVTFALRDPRAIDAAGWLQIPLTHGVEDTFVFEVAPAVERLDYDVDVQGVAGLRLVGNSLEFLEESGTPRLRVAPPFALDAAQRHVEARLSVSGCAYDTSPVAPWGRPVVAPGAPLCMVHVSWHAQRYPVLVDPQWVTTEDMSVARIYHAAGLLDSGRVLVAGGQSSTTHHSSTELYDGATKTFAATADMHARRTAFALAKLPSGELLVMGGDGAETSLSSAELYDETLGTFRITGSMANARAGFGAEVLASGDVLVADGYQLSVVGNQQVSQPTKTAEIYRHESGVFENTGPTQDEHNNTVLVRLPNRNDVLLVGNNGRLELYDPDAGSFTAGAVFGQSNVHVVRVGEQVLLASDPVFPPSGNLYTPSTGLVLPTGAPAEGHDLGTATELGDGRALLVGGQAASQLGSTATEEFNVNTGSFTPGPSLSHGRFRHTATRLATGEVLVAGGISSSGLNNTLASAEVLTTLAVQGAICTDSAQCGTGHCVDGVCCSTQCGQCGACDVTGFVGTCIPVSGAPRAGRPPCAGADAGADESCAGSCDGVTADACTLPVANACASSCSNARSVTSTCDGQGHCIESAAVPCSANLQCDSLSACKTSCTVDGDCTGTSVCRESQCAASSTPTTVVDAGAVSSGSRGDGPAPSARDEGGCAIGHGVGGQEARFAFVLALALAARRKRGRS